MFNAIAAGVAGVALAATSAIIPVKDLGENSHGWEKGGRNPNSYSVTFTEDAVVLKHTGQGGRRDGTDEAVRGCRGPDKLVKDGKLNGRPQG